MSEYEECIPVLENNDMSLTDSPSHSQDLAREEAGTSGNENNLDQTNSEPVEDINLQLFNIIAKLKENDNFEGNPDFLTFQSCFEQLVTDSRIDINRTDNRGNTPLHYTVKYKWDKLTKLLLEHNAYIGVKNARGELPIEGISYNILSEFFDSRITSNCNHLSKNNDRYEINLDYSFLIRKPIAQNKSSTNTNQFDPIQFISESEHLRQLILHPLIHYLIWTKSETLAYLFIWNGITFLLSLLSIIHITFFRQTPTTADQSKFMFISTLIGTCSCICVNLIMFIFKYLDYKNSSVRLSVYLRREIIPTLYNVIISATLITILLLDEGDWRKSLTAGCILLIAIDMNQLITTFPQFQKMSVHFIMLKKITFRFIQVLLFYLIILSAFSLSFYLLDDEGRDDPTKTSQLYQFFVRVIGMMVGELNLSFDDHLAVYYILMLVFIFMITIVLINLLNGLAITDIGEIHLRAKLIYLMYRVHLIASCNNFFTNYVWLRYFIFRVTRCLARTYARYTCSSRMSCSLCFHVDVALCRYVKEIKIQPNRNLTTIRNVLKPMDELDCDTIEWNKINKNILNKMLGHIETKLELKMAIEKENELKNMMEQINLKLDMLFSTQISI